MTWDSGNDEMILVFITTEFPPGPGGIGTHAYHVAGQLSRMGMTVKVLCPCDYVDAKTARQFDEFRNFEIARWPHSRFAPYKIIKRLLYCLNQCRSWKASCLLASNSSGALYAWIVAKILRLPYIAIGHGAEFTFHKGPMKTLVRIAFNRAGKIVCVSHFTKHLAERFGIRPGKIRVIYNGADANTFFPTDGIQALKARLGLQGQKIILTVGKVSERKAQDVVIRAMPVILNKCPNALYLVVGLPTKKAEYEELAKKLGVDHRVKFTGAVPVTDLPAYYNVCDVFVLNSRTARDGENEGFGIVLVEAGLCGKPVVGTRGCGIEEVILDEDTGLLVDPDSPDQTSHAIMKLLDDPESAWRMGQRGRERALAMFTWEHCGKEFLDLLMTLNNNEPHIGHIPHSPLRS